jgi:hypothetical protein
LLKNAENFNIFRGRFFSRIEIIFLISPDNHRHRSRHFGRLNAIRLGSKAVDLNGFRHFDIRGVGAGDTGGGGTGFDQGGSIIFCYPFAPSLAVPGSREALEAEHGKVWDTKQLSEDFEVLGFAAPLVVV